MRDSPYSQQDATCQSPGTDRTWFAWHRKGKEPSRHSGADSLKDAQPGDIQPPRRLSRYTYHALANPLSKLKGYMRYGVTKPLENKDFGTMADAEQVKAKESTEYFVAFESGKRLAKKTLRKMMIPRQCPYCTRHTSDIVGIVSEHPVEVEESMQPWKITAYSTLPLKAMSRWWGWINDIELPIWMRSSSYTLYSYMFGVNLDEIEQKDLSTYKNLGEFFYRRLESGARPVDETVPLVSPSDGTVIKLGAITSGRIEQVKGVSYSVEALLGRPKPEEEPETANTDWEVTARDEEFAIMNGISYTVDDMIGNDVAKDYEKVRDDIDLDNGAESPKHHWHNFLSKPAAPSGHYGSVPHDRALFYAVIYLSPGDYHHFHSPANWVAELRRHFVGELYSVAPYFQTRFNNLFVLNERVALLGRWKYGFFSMTPVGATNVGSIQLNFDPMVVTNSVYKLFPETGNHQHGSTTAGNDNSSNAGAGTGSRFGFHRLGRRRHHHRHERAAKRTCYEAAYTHYRLRRSRQNTTGHALQKGEEMGGFKLGSTVVLVFEAPTPFKFLVEQAQQVKVGQGLGKC